MAEIRFCFDADGGKKYSEVVSLCLRFLRTVQVSADGVDARRSLWDAESNREEPISAFTACEMSFLLAEDLWSKDWLLTGKSGPFTSVNSCCDGPSSKWSGMNDAEVVLVRDRGASS